jgi:hypothetical protein
MTAPLPSPEQTKEILAQFATRATFEQAVAGLLGAGFERTDLSVLASHDSLEIAGDIGGYRPASGRGVSAALEEQLPWIAPFVMAGAILVAAGPIGIAVAGVAGAAAGAIALRPVFDAAMGDVHAERFSQAVADGRILLWVRVTTPSQVAAAEDLLKGASAESVTRLTTVMLETL